MAAAPSIVLVDEERCALARIVAASSSQVRMVERARIVLRTSLLLVVHSASATQPVRR
jgi:hypothetical protein